MAGIKASELPPDEKKRHRSPNYPTVSLREAVERLGNLYKRDGKAGAPSELAAVHIGFSKPHGQAMSVLAALKKFGLITESNGRIVPTQAGIEIVNLRADDPRRIAALRTAVQAPATYRELIERHKDTGWPDDDVLERELVTYKNFNPNAVEGFVKDLKDSLEFAGLSDLSALELSVEDNSGVSESAVMTQLEPSAVETGFKRGSSPAKTPSQPASGRTPVGNDIPVAPDCIMGVNAAGRVTQAGIEKLIAYLQLIKGSFPENGSS